MLPQSGVPAKSEITWDGHPSTSRVAVDHGDVQSLGTLTLSSASTLLSVECCRQTVYWLPGGGGGVQGRSNATAWPNKPYVQHRSLQVNVPSVRVQIHFAHLGARHSSPQLHRVAVPAAPGTVLHTRSIQPVDEGGAPNLPDLKHPSRSISRLIPGSTRPPGPSPSMQPRKPPAQN